MSIYKSFEKVIHSFGMQKITHPLFYNTKIAIRFNIGDNNNNVFLDDSVNPEYIAACLNRAKQIYSALKNAPDILVIDGYLYEDDTSESFINTVISATDLPYPQEIKSEKICEGEDEFIHIFLCWKLNKFEPDKLFREIILADLGGNHFLTSSVYFACSKDSILFHLYDDRGADLCSEKTESISHIYKKLNNLILDYDRERIDAVFKAE